MIGRLPTALEVGGKLCEIRSDYRVVLNIFQAFNDPKLSDGEKWYVCVKCLYVDSNNIPNEDIAEAIKKAGWFLNGGDMPKSEESVKVMDWEHDERIIFPAVNKAAGFEVRQCEYLHWWTFLGYFGEMSEGYFATVINLRRKQAEGKLEKWEKDFIRKNKDIFVLRTAEEQAAIDETEEFLKTLI